MKIQQFKNLLIIFTILNSVLSVKAFDSNDETLELVLLIIAILAIIGFLIFLVVLYKRAQRVKKYVNERNEYKVNINQNPKKPLEKIEEGQEENQEQQQLRVEGPQVKLSSANNSHNLIKKETVDPESSPDLAENETDTENTSNVQEKGEYSFMNKQFQHNFKRPAPVFQQPPHLPVCPDWQPPKSAGDKQTINMHEQQD